MRLIKTGNKFLCGECGHLGLMILIKRKRYFNKDKTVSHLSRRARCQKCGATHLIPEE